MTCYVGKLAGVLVNVSSGRTHNAELPSASAAESEQTRLTTSFFAETGQHIALLRVLLLIWAQFFSIEKLYFGKSRELIHNAGMNAAISPCLNLTTQRFLT